MNHAHYCNQVPCDKEQRIRLHSTLVVKAQTLAIANDDQSETLLLLFRLSSLFLLIFFYEFPIHTFSTCLYLSFFLFKQISVGE